MNIPINEENCELTTLYYIIVGTLYWIPKCQKNQYLDRYIPGSSTCSTKELSITMTKILHAVKGGLLSYCDKVYSRGNINQKHRIGDVMVSALALSAVDRGFEPRSGQTKDYTIGMCCFSAKYAALRRKRKDCLVRNQKSLKIPKGQWETVYRRRTDNTMAKRKSTKGQTMIDKTYI